MTVFSGLIAWKRLFIKNSPLVIQASYTQNPNISGSLEKNAILTKRSSFGI